jgi:hypothetical protein
VNTTIGSELNHPQVSVNLDPYAHINEALESGLFYKFFDKEPRPFGDPLTDKKVFTFGFKSRSYDLRSLPYRVIADKFNEYKADGNIESAIKCCHTRRIIG